MFRFAIPYVLSNVPSRTTPTKSGDKLHIIRIYLALPEPDPITGQLLSETELISNNAPPQGTNRGMALFESDGRRINLSALEGAHLDNEHWNNLMNNWRQSQRTNQQQTK